MLNIENIHFLFSIWLLINLSIGMFLVNCEVTTLTRQLGQDLISGWFLQPSQIRWPFLHWKIFLGGTITITPRQTGHSNSFSSLGFSLGFLSFSSCLLVTAISFSSCFSSFSCSFSCLWREASNSQIWRNVGSLSSS